LPAAASGTLILAWQLLQLINIRNTPMSRGGETCNRSLASLVGALR
jgi:hypothetical protein